MTRKRLLDLKPKGLTLSPLYAESCQNLHSTLYWKHEGSPVQLFVVIMEVIKPNPGALKIVFITGLLLTYLFLFPFLPFHWEFLLT